MTRCLLAFAIWLLAFRASAVALEFSVHENDSATESAILAKGSIDNEDAFRFAAYLAKLPAKSTTTLYFDSTGGSVRGAMALGREIFKSKVRTAVVGSAKCNSACTLAFMAGRDKATDKSYRLKESQSRLSFHHFVPVLQDKQYTNSDAALEEQNAQKMVFDLTVYFDEIAADFDVLWYSLRQKEPYVLRNEEALGLGIHVRDAQTKELVSADDYRRRMGKF